MLGKHTLSTHGISPSQVTFAWSPTSFHSWNAVQPSNAGPRTRQQLNFSSIIEFGDTQSLVLVEYSSANPCLICAIQVVRPVHWGARPACWLKKKTTTDTSLLVLEFSRSLLLVPCYDLLRRLSSIIELLDTKSLALVECSYSPVQVWYGPFFFSKTMATTDTSLVLELHGPCYEHATVGISFK